MTPHRELFWNISSVWIFYLLAASALGIFFFGLFIRVKTWTKGVKPPVLSFKGLTDLFLDGLLGRRIFKGDIAAGIMHSFILFGFLGLFIGTLLLAANDYIIRFLFGSIYIMYSMSLEVVGLMLMVGLLWAIFRRYFQRVSRLERHFADLLVLLWLSIVVLSGFFVEGFRISAQEPEWGSRSFIGYQLGLVLHYLGDAHLLHVYFWWIHVIFSVSLIAALPFLKLFHFLAAPVSIYFENQPLYEIPIESQDTEGELFTYREMVFFDACTRCGRCVAVCPSSGAGEAFSPRDVITGIKEALSKKYNPLTFLPPYKHRLENAAGNVRIPIARGIWHCTSCRACLEVCPVYIMPPEIVRKERNRILEEGTQVPEILFQTLENLDRYNNPLGVPKKNRTKWSQDMQLVDFKRNEQTETTCETLCFFVGCTTSLDIRARELARSFSKILLHAGIHFGTFGEKEPCCGDIARRVGEDALFEDQMESCLELFNRHAVQKVVTSSPHCYNTFRNEYPAFQDLKPAEERVKFQAFHYTQILEKLVNEKKIMFEQSLDVKITYHDPCYLGRHNQVYDAPRHVITAIPGIQFIEMAHHHNDSLCCGGGGGRIWQEGLDADVKMPEIRIKEASETGAKILITACPLCLIMLEDALKTSGLENSLKVLDLNELVGMALGL